MQNSEEIRNRMSAMATLSVTDRDTAQNLQIETEEKRLEAHDLVCALPLEADDQYAAMMASLFATVEHPEQVSDIQEEVTQLWAAADSQDVLAIQADVHAKVKEAEHLGAAQGNFSQEISEALFFADSVDAKAMSQQAQDIFEFVERRTVQRDGNFGKK
jgi:hypothetical protein